jgi:hypothetical protein
MCKETKTKIIIQKSRGRRTREVQFETPLFSFFGGARPCGRKRFVISEKMAREYLAYLAPAAFLVGAAIPDLGASFLLLASKSSSANSAIWRISVYTWASLAFFILAQFMISDYIASPYIVPTWFVGTVVTANYIGNMLVTVGITTLLVLRIRIFYGKSHSFYNFMLISGATVILLKAWANGIGAYIGVQSAQGLYQNFKQHPLYKQISFWMAIAMAAEGLIAIVGTLSFISFLSGNPIKNISKTQSTLIGKEIFRIVLIAVSNVICVGFGIWIIFDDNYINHIAFYLPSLIYSLELYCFLDLSYNIARAIVSEQKAPSSGGDSKSTLSKIANDYSDHKQSSRGKDSSNSNNQFPQYDYRNQYANGSDTDTSPKNNYSKPPTRYQQQQISVTSSITELESYSPNREQQFPQYDYRNQYESRKG